MNRIHHAEFLNQGLSSEAAAQYLRLGGVVPESAAVIRNVAPAFSDAVSSMQSVIEANKFFIINGLSVCNSKEEFRSFCLAIGVLLGDLAVQNAAGLNIVEVYDRRIGTIQEGVRYHQTRQGGDIHTDSVNDPLSFRYVLLGCVAPALLGGESIIVLANDVRQALERIPHALKTLRDPFWFESRGMADKLSLFQLPVFSDTDGVSRFRYLRSYIEAAHSKAGQPMTLDQVFAFDALDAALECSSLQQRFTLGPGDLLICLDSEVFHGRTSFIDSGSSGEWAPQRLMFRLWAKWPNDKRHSHSGY